jgi:hypothetical protein
MQNTENSGNNKIKIIIFISTILIIVGSIIYLFIKRNKQNDKTNNKLYDLKVRYNSLKENKLEKNDDVLIKNIEKFLKKFISNRLSGKYRLSNKDVISLDKNFTFINGQIIDEILKIYSSFDIQNIIEQDPYDIYDNLLKAQINRDKLMIDEQIAALAYLENKHPKEVPTILIEYIKKNSNLFQIKGIDFKNGCPKFSEEQKMILDKFK